MLQDAIYDLLKGVEADIYPNVGEQSVNPPFIVHTRVSTEPTYNKDGNQKKDFVAYRVACYGEKSSDTDQLAKDVLEILDEYSGINSGVDITQIRLSNEESGYDEEIKFYYTIQTYRIIMGNLT